MRVIAGTARGLRLSAPRGTATRPTADRVREALFSILAPRLAGAHFLDLYAGSGANGIEALSRGAVQAVFVETGRDALAALRANLGHTGFEARSVVRRVPLPSGLSRLTGPPAPYGIIFADPPYQQAPYDALLAGIADANLLGESGVVVFEHDRAAALPESQAGYTRTRLAAYGNTALSFYA